MIGHEKKKSKTIPLATNLTCFPLIKLQIAHWSLQRASARIAAEKQCRESANKEEEAQAAEELGMFLGLIFLVFRSMLVLHILIII